MTTDLIKYLNGTSKGEQIFIAFDRLIFYGTFDEVVDNCIVLSDVTFPQSGKKQDHMVVPVEKIYAWGRELEQISGQLMV